jgi:hypothetical protein
LACFGVRAIGAAAFAWARLVYFRFVLGGGRDVVELNGFVSPDLLSRCFAGDPAAVGSLRATGDAKLVEAVRDCAHLEASLLGDRLTFLWLFAQHRFNDVFVGAHSASHVSRAAIA